MNKYRRARKARTNRQIKRTIEARQALLKIELAQIYASATIASHAIASQRFPSAALRIVAVVNQVRDAAVAITNARQRWQNANFKNPAPH